MPTASASIEIWTRVLCHLPNATLPERQAFDRIIRYVKRLRVSVSEVTGLTQIDRAAGQWWDNSNRIWVNDTVSLLIVDFPGDAVTDQSLARRIARIRQFAFVCYRFYDPKKTGQDEIWTMMHPVTRFSDHPRRKPAGVEGMASDIA